VTDSRPRNASAATTLTVLACLLAMTACSSTHSTPPTDVACQTFRPIAYDSREIPPDLTRQIREYHAVLLRLCPGMNAGTARP
jgi:hypothetical protein